jgi:hypothetical protein
MAEYTRRSNLEMVTTTERMGIDNIAASFNAWLILEDSERYEKYTEYREYYDGEHEALLTERQKQFLELKPNTPEFSANYCPLVCKEVSRRLRVRGFDGPTLGGKDGPLWNWWRKNKMDAQSKDVHLSSIRDGDAFLIVGWDNEKDIPSYFPNLAFDGSDGVDVHYNDETGKIDFAVKYWIVRDYEDAGYKRRANMYYADRIERYVSDDRTDDGNWHWYTEDGQDGILPWVDKTGKPLGVPVFHFANDRAGMRWGVSALEPVIPLQNALNKSVIDLIAAADTTGFRIHYVTGENMLDENEEEIKIHPGTFLSSTNENAKFGFIPGEDLRPLIEVMDAFKISIAQVTETPLHLFQVSGQNASEGAQKQQEVGMISKAEDTATYFGNDWEDIMALSVRLHNAFSSQPPLPEDEMVETLWGDFEVRDRVGRVLEQSEAVNKLTSSGAQIEAAARAALFDDETAKNLGRFAVPVGMISTQPPQEDNGEPDADTD